MHEINFSYLTTIQNSQWEMFLKIGALWFFLEALEKLQLKWIKSILIHEYQHKSTRVNTNQHEPDTSQHEYDTSNTSPTQVNTN